MYSLKNILLLLITVLIVNTGQIFAQNGTINAEVWLDTSPSGNNQVYKNSGELPATGIEVELINTADELVAETQTDANGIATFNDVDAGTYKLKFILPADHAFTKKTNQTITNDDRSDAIQSGSDKGLTAEFTIGSDETINYVDAGIWTYGSIETEVWSDLSAPGNDQVIKQSNEPALEGIKVELLDVNNGSAVLARSYTNANGIASFNNIVPADRPVSLKYYLPEDYAFTFRKSTSFESDDRNDADPNTGETNSFSMKQGSEKIEYVDCGMWAPGVIKTQVFGDINDNVIKDANEKGLFNVSVFLLEEDGTSVTYPSWHSKSGQNVFAVTSCNNGLANLYLPADRKVKLKYESDGADWTFRKSTSFSSDDRNDADDNGLTIAFGADRGTHTIEYVDAGIADRGSSWTDASVETFVWDDTDGDGNQRNEYGNGIEGVKVRLLDENGYECDCIETDDNGEVEFDIISGKKFRLKYDLPENHAFTHQNKGDDRRDSDVHRTWANTSYFTLSEGETLNNIDAGMWTPGSVESFVWDDRNGNGRCDNGEANYGIEGVKVTLQRSSNKEVLGEGTTDENGKVTIEGVPADTDCRLVFNLLDDYAFTKQNIGSDTKDSDPHRTWGTSANFRTKKGNEKITHVDAGMWSPGSVESFVWDDRNGNGRCDNGEANYGIEGVKVTLQRSSNKEVLGMGTTDSEGKVTIEGVPADTDCRLVFDLLDDYAFTKQNVGSDTKDSDPHRTWGTSANFRTKKGNEKITHVDAGMWSPGSVESFVWDDRNGNGRCDNGEANYGISGVTVTLQRSSNKENLGTGVTDADGKVTIDGVPADTDCRLVFDLPEDYAFTHQNKTADTKDSDPHRTWGTTANFKTKKGKETVTHVDAGMWSPGSVESFVWDDRNGNGRCDNGEANYGIEGVKVTLQRSSNKEVLGEGTTDENGKVTIEGVPADTDCRLVYILPENHAFTHQNKTADTKDSDPHRSWGTTANFKTKKGKETVTHVDAGMWTPGSVETFVWDDRNGNGKCDNGEAKYGIEGVKVTLQKSSNKSVLGEGTTDENGKVTIDGVPADTDCRLVYDLPAKHAFTLQNKTSDTKDSDPHRTWGTTANFKTAKGKELITHVDAGMWTPGSAKVYVWNDKNENGKQDGNEYPLPLVKVEVQEVSGNKYVNHAYTDANGIAHVTGIPADKDVRIKVYQHTTAYVFTEPNKTNDKRDSDTDKKWGRTSNFKTNRGNQLFQDYDAGFIVDMDVDSDGDKIPDFLDKYPTDFSNNNMGAIASKAWDDRDGDGRYDNNEPGVGKIRTILRKGSNSSKLKENTSHPYNGLVCFFDLDETQTYRLEFVKPALHAITKYNVGKSWENSDIASNGRTNAFAMNGVVTDQDAGFWAPANVEAKVWDDLDGDGRQDNNEPGIDGVRVILRKASNNSKIAETTTKKGGIAKFKNVPADYACRLEFVKPTGHDFAQFKIGKSWENSDIESTNGRTSAFAADRGSDLINDCDGGFISPAKVLARVWDDIDGDGRQDNNEPGIANATVILRKASNNSKISEATTDANGIATILGVPADIDFRLEFVRPKDHAFAPFKVGKSWENSDIESSNGRTDSYKANKGAQTFNDIDGGFFSPSEIQAKVWDDQDGDGRQDNNEPGIANATVIVRKASNNSKIKEGKTDANGVATISDIPANVEFKLEFVRPSKHAYAPNNVGKSWENSDAQTGNGYTGKFMASKGSQIFKDIDGGFFSPSTVEAKVWDDQDGDGRQDNNEPGIANATVILRKVSNNSKIAEAKTDANGVATISNISANEEFKLEFVRPKDHAYAPYNVGKSWENSDAQTSNGYTNNFKASKGAQTFKDIDGGFFAPGTVIATVWNDVDKDGKFDSNEEEISGVTVTLRNQTNGKKLADKKTDTNGEVKFENVPANIQFLLQFDKPNSSYNYTKLNVGKSWEDSDANPNNDGKTSVLQLSKGSQTIKDYDAGFYLPVLTKFAFDIEDETLDLTIPNVYPNPSEGIFKINNLNTYNELIIVDLFGNVVFKTQLEEVNELEIDLGNVAAGSYFIRLIGDDAQISRSLIIQ